MRLRALETRFVTSSLFSRILVGVDDSQPSKEAVALAARLACERRGRLFLAHAVNWLPLVAEVVSTGAVIDPNPMIEGLKQQGLELLEQAAQIAQRAGSEAERRMAEGEAAQALVKLAGELACGLIVMGTHGRRGLGRQFIGSTTEAVLRGSTIPVLTVRPGMRMEGEGRRCFERILVGIDDSEPSDAALKTALQVPALERCSITFVSVIDTDSVIGARGYSHVAAHEELYQQAKSVVDAALAAARAASIAVEGEVLEGRIGDELLAVARERKADLIVLGSHGRRGLQRFFLGSVAEGIVRSAPVPVLVVRCKSNVAAASTRVKADLTGV